MGAEHKLFKLIDGEPLLRRSVRGICASAVDEVVVVVGARADDARSLLADLPVRVVDSPRWRDGMAESLAAGIRALSPKADAALIALADMPDIGAAHVNRLIAGYAPEDGREILRAVAASGKPGHPTLFGRRFFAEILALRGDIGARSVIQTHSGALTDVVMDDEAPATDLDDPAAWETYLDANATKSPFVDTP